MQNITGNAVTLPAGLGAYGMPAPTAPATQPVMVTPQATVDPQLYAQFQAAQAQAAQAQAATLGAYANPAAMAMNPAMATNPAMGMSPSMGVDPAVLAGYPQGAAQATLGAEGMKPPSTLGSVVKSVLVMGGLGAALGAGFGLIPFLPGGPISGAIVGGIAGALLGVVRGIRSAKHAQDEYKMMMQAAPVDPNAVPVEVANTGPRRKARKKARKAKPRTVTVRAGDTLTSIAKRHHVTVEQVRKLNHTTKLTPGMHLKLPARR